MLRELQELRKKWRIIPVRYKAVTVLVLLAVVSGLVMWGFTGRQLRAEALRDVFFLPLFMSALLFGLRGGLICFFIIALTYAGDLYADWPVDGATLVDLGLEVGVLAFTGCVTGILVDRERREARRLREAESLALLGMAAAAVAHELKNPLIAIGGFTQRIHKQLDDDHPHKKMLGMVVEQTAHMERLLREMLDFSRPVELKKDVVSLNLIVEEVVSLLGDSAAGAKVALRPQLDEKVGEFPLDSGRIKQILMNLIQNAVQASPEGGVVTVSTRRNGARLAEVRVCDQGKGVPEEIREKIFLPFFTTKAKGTGLGLALSAKLAHAHGGSLEICQDYQKGCMFSLTLPL